MDPQIFQKGVQRTPKLENLDTSLKIYLLLFLISFIHSVLLVH